MIPDFLSPKIPSASPCSPPPTHRRERMYDSVASRRVPVAVYTCGAELEFKV